MATCLSTSIRSAFVEEDVVDDLPSPPPTKGKKKRKQTAISKPTAATASKLPAISPSTALFVLSTIMAGTDNRSKQAREALISDQGAYELL